MMNTVLVLYPKAFNCQSKFNRKLINITRNMSHYRLVCLNDYRGLIRHYSADFNVSMSVEEISLEDLDFTHAIVFDDGEEFVQQVKTIEALNRPLRLLMYQLRELLT